MKIDGRQIASDIKYGLKQQIIPLRKKHLIPHLAVILIGNDPNSLAYIRQKQKVGRRIKAKVSLFHFQSFID
ncbi:bifunctional methylenetetrahydrofolate dehydrogenase/methenyltetrahydrofolate cyclohydrolase, partial [Candidatus Gottesmanbacteria bacterium]|nr:bifunctional methylenetetrahydrofolate dehydrogenase/methenyltetrahydrofolate cyclohydrolase [Candidatus Gottesmanbacteria bacterium]